MFHFDTVPTLPFIQLCGSFVWFLPELFAYPSPPQGIDGMVPFVSRRVVALTASDAIRVLKEANPLTTSLSLSTQQTLTSKGVRMLSLVQ